MQNSYWNINYEESFVKKVINRIEEYPEETDRELVGKLLE